MKISLPQSAVKQFTLRLNGSSAEISEEEAEPNTGVTVSELRAGSFVKILKNRAQ